MTKESTISEFCTDLNDENNFIDSLQILTKVYKLSPVEEMARNFLVK
jgi:hypothetical protein